MNSSVNENSKVYYTGKYWNDYPECLSIINTRLFNEDISWIEFLKKQKLVNFKKALILNCGNGWVERELYDNSIILNAVGVEYNQDLVNECNKNKNDRKIEYVKHDINTVNFADNSFDLIINFAACHHIRYIEKVCNNIRNWLKPDGYFIHNDYIGPQRNQYTKKQWNKMNQINNMLHLSVRKSLGYPDVIQMMIDDPTEAINSNRIIPVIYDLFNIDYHTKSGGAIAYEILTHNHKLFGINANQREHCVKKIMEKDLEYMKETGESFFHFIIARNNKEVSEKIIDKNLAIMNSREKLADRTFGHYSYNCLEINELIKCNTNTYEKSFFVYGFSAREPLGRWSMGNTSIIRFKYDDCGNNKLQISVNSLPNYSQKLRIEINEMKTIDISVKSNTVLELPLIQNKDYPNEAVIIFTYFDVTTPRDLGLIDDGRVLALFFKWIKLV